MQVPRLRDAGGQGILSWALKSELLRVYRSSLALSVLAYYYRWDLMLRYKPLCRPYGAHVLALGGLVSGCVAPMGLVRMCTPDGLQASLISIGFLHFARRHFAFLPDQLFAFRTSTRRHLAFLSYELFAFHTSERRHVGTLHFFPPLPDLNPYFTLPILLY